MRWSRVRVPAGSHQASLRVNSLEATLALIVPTSHPVWLRQNRRSCFWVAFPISSVTSLRSTEFGRFGLKTPLRFYILLPPRSNHECQNRRKRRGLYVLPSVCSCHGTSGNNQC